MRDFRTLGWRGMLMGAGLLAACTETKPKPRVWSSAAFTYISEANDPVCEAVLTTLTQHRRAIVEYLELDDAQVGNVRYRKFLNWPDLAERAHCSPHSSACFFRQFGIESFHPFEQHELIHAYLAHLGDSHKLLEEGVAEALTCDDKLVPRSEIGVEAAWAQTSWASTDVEALRSLYHAGAWFVGYLLKAYPPALFGRFYESVEPNDEAPQVAVKFASVYPDELALVWPRALAQPEADAPCVPAYACASPKATIGLAAGEMDAPSCDARPALSTVDLNGETWLHVPSLPAHMAERDWQLGACAPNLSLPHEPLRSPQSGTTFGESHWLMLAQGKYWTSVAPGALVVGAGDKTLVPDRECGNVRPLTGVSLNDATFAVSGKSLRLISATAPEQSTGVAPNAPGEVAPPNAPRAWILALQVGEAAGVRVLTQCGPNVRVEVCESCDYMTTCQVTCDSGVGRSVLLPTDTPQVRVTMADEADAWFRLSRVSR